MQLFTMLWAAWIVLFYSKLIFTVDNLCTNLLNIRHVLYHYFCTLLFSKVMDPNYSIICRMDGVMLKK